MVNIGILNDYQIIEAINNKKIKDVSFLFQELFYSFFKNIDENSIIKAYKGNEIEKTDIVVKINNQRLNISVKMEIKNSVHCENIYYFLKFLKELKINQEAIEKYLLYHYADGTKNGTWKNRMSAKEYKELHQKEIDMVNKYFNDPKNMEKIANKFLFKGNQESNSLVDIILWGTKDEFFYVYRDEVISYLKENCKIYMTCPHFGRLSIQPSRDVLTVKMKKEEKK